VLVWLAIARVTPRPTRPARDSAGALVSRE
jgi:hypothetical protein